MADNNFISQSKEFFAKLTKTQKFIIFGALSLVLTGVALLIFTSSKKDFGVLYNNLEQKDAGKIIEKLKEKQIEYEIKDGGATLEIPKDKIYETRIAFATEGLPENSENVGYGLFDKPNLGMSEFVQKLNNKRALEGELAKTIGAFDEVQKVRVHLVIPEKTLFNKDQKKPTASVSLKFKSGKSLSKLSVEGIQHLVASGIEGLDPKDVTVVDSRANILSAAAIDENTPGGISSIQHEQQKKIDEYLSQKVQSLLDGVLGGNNAQVRVNVELDFTQSEKTITDFDPEKQVKRSEQIISEKSQSTDSLNYPAVNSAKEQGNQINNYEISKTVEKIVGEVGRVRRLSVAALINGTYKVNNGPPKKLEYAPRSEEEMNKLTDIIKNSVGYDPSRNDQVSVMNVPFDPVGTEEEMLPPDTGYTMTTRDMVKIGILIFAMLLTLYLVFRILASRQVKGHIQKFLGPPEPLPEEIEEKEEEYEEEEDDEDENHMLLLPTDLPEQLLLESEQLELPPEDYPDEEDVQVGEVQDEIALSSKAKSLLDMPTEELTEDVLMKIEIKSRVQTYIEDQLPEAIKLFKVYMNSEASKPDANKPPKM